MPVQWQNVEILLDKGIDQKTDAKLTAHGSFRKLENAVFEKNLSIAKRGGLVPWASSLFNDGDLLAAASLNDEVMALTTKGNLRTRQFVTGTDQTAGGDWIAKCTGYTPVFEMSSARVLSNYQEPRQPDLAAEADDVGRVLAVWGDGSGAVQVIRASYFDYETGQVFRGDFQLSSGAAHAQRARIAKMSDGFYVYWLETGASAIRFCRVVPTSTYISPGSVNTLATDLYASGGLAIDTVKVPARPDQAIIAYEHNAPASGTNREIKLIKVTGSTTSATATIATGQTAIRNISLSYAGDSHLLILFSNGSSLYFIDVDPTNLSVVQGATLLSAGTGDIQTAEAVHDGGTPGTMTVFWDRYSADGTAYMTTHVRTLALSGYATGAIKTARGLSVAAKPSFNSPTGATAPCIFTDRPQRQCFIIDAEGRVRGKALAGQAFDPVNTGSARNVSHVVASSLFAVRTIIEASELETPGDFRDGVSVVRAKPAASDGTMFRSVQFGDSLYFSGGFVGQYDGASFVEAGFHTYPSEVKEVSQANSGGEMTDGVFGAVAIYEWIDANGDIHRSAPSKVLSVTMNQGTTAQTLTVKVPALRLTAKDGTNASKASVVLYTTIKNGITYYRTAEALNDTTADYISLTRTQSDATISAMPTLYTQGPGGSTGGELENIAPRACSIVAASTNRVFFSGLEGDKTLVLYTKERASGLGLRPTDAFTLRVPEDAGAVTGIGVLDERVFIFTRSRIYAFIGEGPDDTGSGNFQGPVLIPGAVGCKDPGSVVLIPQGLMFNSDKGIYLLDRSLTISYIGAPVEDEANGSTYIATVVQKDANRVIFLKTSGNAVVYDFLFGRWSVFTNHYGISALPYGASSYLLARAGPDQGETIRVLEHKASTYTDDGAQYTRKAEFGWFRFAGIQGFKRVRRVAVLGDVKAESRLKVEAAYDYSDTVVDTITHDFAAGDVGKAFGVRARLDRQLCESVKLTLTDAATAGAVGPGQGWVLSGLMFEVGLKSGLGRKSGALTVG